MQERFTAEFLAAVPPDQTIPSLQQFATGSGRFKQYVLGELAHQVQQGRASWDEQLAIRDDLKSPPSGKLQVEPAGTSHTLRVFAEQMISISDNTPPTI